ncbi:MAG: serine/threonine-protein kinase, partial [Thermoguttaceae bacterium]
MPDLPEISRLLAELRSDQRNRWLAGDRRMVEDYLAAHRSLAGNEETLLDFIYSEVCLREELGETIEPDEYLRRFPQWKSSIVRLFEVHQGLRDNSPVAAGVAASAADVVSPVEGLSSSLPGEYERLEKLGESGIERLSAALNESPCRSRPEETVSSDPTLPAAGQAREERCSSTPRPGQAEPSSPQALHIRCPHCRNPINVVDDTPLAEIVCPSCGGNFGLIGDEALAVRSEGGGPHRRQAFAHFELIEQLGFGAFGAVWKARDTKLDRTVALKIPRKGELSPEEAEKFVREARAAAQIKHPGVVGVHEVGREDGTLYIVSDFIDGCSLKEWLYGHKLTPREAAELCMRIAEALDVAHEAGVVHRDLKPS